MKEEMKTKKIADEMMETVSGGSSREMASDERAIAAMLGINPDKVNPGIVGDAFASAHIKVDFHSDGSANVYTYNGRRVSRYEAIVRLARAHGKGDFDVRPYMSDTHSDNNRNI